LVCLCICICVFWYSCILKARNCVGGVPAGAFLLTNDIFMKYTPRGLTKWTGFVSSDLKKLINIYSATYPNPYCGEKLNQCIQKIPKYRRLSLNEDINQTRKYKFAEHTNYIPSGLSESCFFMFLREGSYYLITSISLPFFNGNSWELCLDGCTSICVVFVLY